MRKLLLGGAALAALAAYPLLAQDAPPRGEGRAARIDMMVERLFATLDTNRDGVVTKAEYEDARAKRWAAMEERHAAMRGQAFDRLDTNHDGSISRQEFAAAPPPPPPPGAMADGGMPPPPPGRAMADGRMPPPPPPPGRDGMAPPPPPRMGRPGMGPGGPGMEPGGGMGMLALGDRWFDRADANKDGKVTLAEARKEAEAMAGRRMAMRDRRGPGAPPAPGGDMPPRPWRAE